MDEPPVAEALLIGRNGRRGRYPGRGVGARWRRGAGLRHRENVAYPGFIDAHAHWIGDREHCGLESAAEAMDAAVSRGWLDVIATIVDGIVVYCSETEVCGGD